MLLPLHRIRINFLLPYRRTLISNSEVPCIYEQVFVRAGRGTNCESKGNFALFCIAWLSWRPHTRTRFTHLHHCHCCSCVHSGDSSSKKKKISAKRRGNIIAKRARVFASRWSETTFFFNFLFLPVLAGYLPAGWPAPSPSLSLLSEVFFLLLRAGQKGSRNEFSFGQCQSKSKLDKPIEVGRLFGSSLMLLGGSR